MVFCTKSNTKSTALVEIITNHNVLREERLACPPIAYHAASATSQYIVPSTRAKVSLSYAPTPRASH